MIKKLGFIAILAIGFLVYKVFIVPTGTKVGDLAPPITAPLINGENFELSQLKGHYVLLDFWGSWCAPCRKDMPGLRSLYSDFNGKEFEQAKNFEIVSIALEKSDQFTEKIIASEGLNWPFHIIEINQYVLLSPLARLYGVKELPSKFLIGPKGKILKVDPSIEEIRSFLDNNAILN